MPSVMPPRVTIMPNYAELCYYADYATPMQLCRFIMLDQVECPIHAHLIPRYPDRPETHAWAIADHYRACNAPGGTFADAADCAAISAKLKALLAANPPP
jgi:hypothetical protein